MQLKCGQRVLDLSRPHVMGIVNVTPDSFSDGGQYNSLDAALKRAESMVQLGATLIDIGGESTRPGADEVSEQVELDRVVPVVEKIAKNLDVVISVDTSTPAVMCESLKVGAGLINDVRSLSREGAIEAVKDSLAAVCLMHMQGEPRTMQNAPHYENVTNEVEDFLRHQIERCVEQGIQRERLVLDPGFGFAKNLEHNLSLFKHMQQLHSFKLPLLVGVSRKSMIGQVLNKTTDQRLIGSVALALMAFERGAQILRVHDVEATMDALKLFNAVQAAV
ncbi:dihydropteroate synthase [Pseudomonas sp. F1_0610]|uniref:dihydropteroate synthase n=1 Tax=Pseudomonas sp. F1_0610 TaxID=3114284 RepID=UPI0039C06AB4